MQQDPKPVRKIGRSHSSLRGKVFSAKTNQLHDFESALERDYLIILEFDLLIEKFVIQPAEIEYVHEGKTRYYTPDVLVFYEDYHSVSKKMKPQLTEIKYSDELKRNEKELKPKFDAAEKFAKSKGWTFKVLTEKDIRTAYLNNAKFLLGYKKVSNTNDGDYLLLKELLQKSGATTPAEIIRLASSDWEKQAQLLYCLWHMVADRFVFCDLTIPLTMDSEIWVIADEI